MWSCCSQLLVWRSRMNFPSELFTVSQAYFESQIRASRTTWQCDECHVILYVKELGDGSFLRGEILICFVSSSDSFNPKVFVYTRWAGFSLAWEQTSDSSSFNKCQIGSKTMSFVREMRLWLWHTSLCILRLHLSFVQLQQKKKAARHWAAIDLDVTGIYSEPSYSNLLNWNRPNETVVQCVSIQQPSNPTVPYSAPETHT